MKENKSWCPIPWIGMNIRNNGDYRVCCHANTSEEKGILKDDAGRSLNAASTPIEEARNSEIIKDVRREMLKGMRHPVCIRCNLEDDAGLRSRRKYEKGYWKDFQLHDAAAVTSQDGSLSSDVPIVFFDLRFGNLCNLKCRMCGPADSSAWYREYYETRGAFFKSGMSHVELEENNQKIEVKGRDAFAWHESESFWRELDQNAGNVKKIYVVGGEPLLIDRHFDFLERIVDSGRAGEVLMEYNSNITVLPQRALLLWRHFREVRIGASIDGHGKINEYIRHPSKWSTVEKNLRALDDADGNIRAWIAPTVQAYNIYYLTDLIRWKIESGFRRVNNLRHSPFITPHPLHTPAHLNIQVLPAAVKDMVEKRFASFFDNWFLPYLCGSGLNGEARAMQEEKMKKLLGGYVSLMRKKDLSHLLPDFWQETKKMDLHRRERFEEVMPEIAGPIQRTLGMAKA